MDLQKIKQEYGEHYHAHVLEMYKLHTEMADRVSQRRGLMNRLYTTAHVALIVLGTKLWIDQEFPLISVFVFSILGLCFAWVWRLNIVSYQQLNAAKFEALDLLEKELPLPFYKIEQAAYSKKKRKDFSSIETTIPWVLCAGYALFLVFNGVQHFFQ